MFYLVRGKDKKLCEVVGVCKDSTIAEVRRALGYFLKFNDNYVSSYKMVKSDLNKDVFIDNAFEVRGKIVSNMRDAEEFYLVLPRTFPIVTDNEAIFESEEFKEIVLTVLGVNSYKIVFDAVCEHLVLKTGLYSVNEDGTEELDCVIDSLDSTILKKLKEDETDMTDMVESELFLGYVDKIKNKKSDIERYTYVFHELMKQDDIKQNLEHIQKILQLSNILSYLGIESVTVSGVACLNKSLKHNSYYIGEKNCIPVRDIDDATIYLDNGETLGRDDCLNGNIKLEVIAERYKDEGNIGAVYYLEYITSSVELEYFITMYLYKFKEMFTKDLLYPKVARILSGVYEKMFDLILYGEKTCD